MEVFRFWTATVLSFFIKDGLKLLKERALEMIRIGFKASKRKIVFEIASHFK